MGHEPLQNTLLIMLKKDKLSEHEEKFVSRQLMSLWKGAEPFVDIRAYRYPCGPRFFGATPCFNDQFEGDIVLGHYRGVIMAANADDDYSYLCPWKRMPVLNFYQVYDNGIESIKQEGDWVVVRSSIGLFVYRLSRLLDYMKNNVKWKDGFFAVDTQIQGLELMGDGDLSTYASLSSSSRSVFGTDLGLPATLNTLNIFPMKGSEGALKGAYIQGSNYSECGAFRNLSRLPKDLEAGKWNRIPFANDKKMRYYRVVTKNSQPIKIAELRWE
ncbi:MAG: hypothetical protein HQL32_04950 [Planctomycetes bacterium]|nr:hypothetical protein [Planctomycetota bacterium]